MEYSFDYKESGDSFADILTKGGEECLAVLPADHWLLTALPSMPNKLDKEDKDNNNPGSYGSTAGASSVADIHDRGGSFNEWQDDDNQ